MTRWITGCLVLTLALGGAAAVSEEKEEEELAIKDVMKQAHTGKPSLKDKVQQGKASDEEKEKLLDLYKALNKKKPPRGDEDEFRKRTEALVTAAKAAVDGKKDAGKLLAKASNCKTCHDNYRGK
jgi:cytochrome c556